MTPIFWKMAMSPEKSHWGIFFRNRDFYFEIRFGPFWIDFDQKKSIFSFVAIFRPMIPIFRKNGYVLSCASDRIHPKIKFESEQNLSESDPSPTIKCLIRTEPILLNHQSGPNRTELNRNWVFRALVYICFSSGTLHCNCSFSPHFNPNLGISPYLQ